MEEKEGIKPKKEAIPDPSCDISPSIVRALSSEGDFPFDYDPKFDPTRVDHRRK